MILAPTNKPGVNHLSGAPEEERDLVDRVMADVLTFEQGIGQDFRTNNVKWFRQYIGSRKFADNWTKSGPNDRDGLVYDAKKHWGAHLHIPLSFRTIETLCSRSIAHRPKLLYLPRSPESEENVGNVRMMVDSQQENIDIDLPFQGVMRSGRTYGLGIGKAFWQTKFAQRRPVKRRMLAPGHYVSKAKWEKTFDDPTFEDVDVFSWMWDPLGYNVESCGWVVHQVWASLGTCLDRIASQAWNTESALLLDEEKLRGMADGTKYDEVWTERMEASGFSSFTTAQRGEQPHELLEWHDGDRVLTVLDRQVLVQDGENPCLGHKPFQIYRPVPVQKQMVGIGDMQPLEHLQAEIDTMRSQMTDAVTLSLAAGWVYDAAAVDEEDLVFGPNKAIEVRNADVRAALMPLQKPELPAGAFQHQALVRQDFDAVPGLSDALSPQDSSSGTATEAQLIQASLAARIQVSSRRFETEVVRQVARAFLYLDQRMIVKPRPPIRQPADGYDLIEAAQVGRWQWFPQGPGEIRGEFEIIPDGGSMAARNIPQDRQDAQLFLSLAENPHIDGRRAIVKALELCQVPNPTAWLAQQAPPVPPLALQILARAGVDQGLLQRAVQMAQQADPQLSQQGPDTAQVAQMMGGGQGG